MTMTRTALYRHFDASGALLYVGISVQPLIRLAAHVWSARWAGDVASVTIEWHEKREAAELAEWAAIQTEQPLHNVKRSPNKPTKSMINAAAADLPEAGQITREAVMATIESLSNETGLAPATITGRACGNTRLYARMKNGGDCTTGIAKRVFAFAAPHSEGAV